MILVLITPFQVFPPGTIVAQFYIPTMHILKVLFTVKGKFAEIPFYEVG
jgi:hypothetical protein